MAIKRTHGCQNRVEAERLRFVFLLSSADQGGIDGSSRSHHPRSFSQWLKTPGPPLHSPHCNRRQPRSEVSSLPAGVPVVLPESSSAMSVLPECEQSFFESAVPPGFCDAPRPLQEERDSLCYCSSCDLRVQISGSRRV